MRELDEDKPLYLVRCWILCRIDVSHNSTVNLYENSPQTLFVKYTYLSPVRSGSDDFDLNVYDRSAVSHSLQFQNFQIVRNRCSKSSVALSRCVKATSRNTSAVNESLQLVSLYGSPLASFLFIFLERSSILGPHIDKTES